MLKKEEKVDELVKFEAFLRDSVNFYGRDSFDTWKKINSLSRGEYNNMDIEKTIKELVEFYRTFNPTRKRRLTMAELRDIVGEDFEIVEE